MQHPRNPSFQVMESDVSVLLPFSRGAENAPIMRNAAATTANAGLLQWLKQAIKEGKVKLNHLKFKLSDRISITKFL